MLPLQISIFNALKRLAILIFTSYKNLLPSDPNKLNLDSSLKPTISHFSSVHRICSVAKSKRTFWFFFEIEGLQHGIRATNLSLFNLREKVLAFQFAHKMYEK